MVEALDEWMPQEPRRAQAKSRMPEIIEAAARLFRGRGYASTSVQDVAEAVGMLKGSLYHYINGKADLLFAVTEDFAKQAEPLLELAGASDGDPVGHLRRVICRHAELIAREPVKAAVFFRDGRHLEGDRREWIITLTREYEHSIRTLVEKGRDAGAFRADLEPMLVARGILGMLNSVYVWFHPSREPLSGTSIGEAYADLVLSGLLAEGGP